MEVDLLRRDAVHAALGVGEPRERRERPLARPRRQGGCLDQAPDLGRAALRLAGRSRHLDTRRVEIAAPRSLDAQLEPVDAERREPGPHGFDVGAGVEQRAEQHVAGHAADTVHIDDAAHTAPAAARAIRAAIVPAPKPSSIPTTASPAAHELNMESRGVTPPNAVP